MRTKQYSRGYLRNIAVLVAAQQIIRLREYNFAEKIHTQENDIELVMKDEDQNSARILIKKLSDKVASSIKNNILSVNDEKFVKQRAVLIIDALLKSELLKKGIIPELCFLYLLFQRFSDVDDRNSKSFPEYSEPQQYYDILDLFEDVDEVNWKLHVDNVDAALERL